MRIGALSFYSDVKKIEEQEKLFKRFGELLWAALGLLVQTPFNVSINNQKKEIFKLTCMPMSSSYFSKKGG